MSDHKTPRPTLRPITLEFYQTNLIPMIIALAGNPRTQRDEIVTGAHELVELAWRLIERQRSAHVDPWSDPDTLIYERQLQEKAIVVFGKRFPAQQTFRMSREEQWAALDSIVEELREQYPRSEGVPSESYPRKP